MHCQCTVVWSDMCKIPRSRNFANKASHLIQSVSSIYCNDFCDYSTFPPLFSFQNEITKNISPLFENFLYCSSTKKKWPWNSPTHQFYVMLPISPFIIYFLFTFFIKAVTSRYVSGGQCSESGSNKEDILLLLSTYVSGGQYSESGSNKEEILLLLSVLLMYKVCLGNTKQS